MIYYQAGRGRWGEGAYVCVCVCVCVCVLYVLSCVCVRIYWVGVVCAYELRMPDDPTSPHLI